MARSLYSLRVCKLYGSYGDNALEVGNLSKCCIGKYRLALLTVPILYVTGLVAYSLDCLYMNDLCYMRDSKSQGRHPCQEPLSEVGFGSHSHSS